MPQLCVVLGDQLSHELSSLQRIDRESDRVLLMEVMNEARYVPHHPKKIAFLFSAMRHFADQLRSEGYNVDYIQLDSPESKSSFTKTLQAYLSQHEFDRVIVTHPGEYRVLTELQKWEKTIGCQCEIVEDTRFYCGLGWFRNWAKNRKTFLLEHFYRAMRKEHDVLMTDKGEPVGEQWNFDQDNRKSLTNPEDLPHPMRFTPDTISEGVLDLVKERFGENFGEVRPFWFAVTSGQASRALHHFIKYALPYFGDYQDAMVRDEYYLYHSALSQYLNCGLLCPKDVCDAAEAAYRSGDAPLNCVEGFIRQILGWREYVRGLYWLLMPDYGNRNHLKAERKLPWLYWGGETKMECMRCVIEQTRKEAHSHHIQRLMVTGNFALLAGIQPAQVCDWYLAVYADAYEWVELPNTLGMALFGDGGVMATKPYAASGNYIRRMSNFCKSCHYDVKQRIGEKACPFNFLYWDFLARHRELLKDNRRLTFAYKNLARIDEKELQSMRRQANEFLNSLD